MNIDWYMQCFIHGVKEVYVVGGGVFRQHLLFSIRGLQHTMPIRHFDSKSMPLLSQNHLYSQGTL